MSAATPSEPSVAIRLAAVQRRIAAAARRSGRDASSISLVAVSKRQPPDLLRQLVAAGHRAFGENRVQEAITKAAELPAHLEWHLIGPLQSNKVTAAVRLFSTIHSVDRLKIAQKIAAAASELRRTIPIFLQVHLGDEPTKHGFPEDQVLAAAREVGELGGVEVVGLMAIPPFSAQPEGSRGWFRRLRELRDELSRLDGPGTFPGFLSMGMSHDFEVAIEEGATHVRVGTALFGPRPD